MELLNKENPRRYETCTDRQCIEWNICEDLRQIKHGTWRSKLAGKVAYQQEIKQTQSKWSHWFVDLSGILFCGQCRPFHRDKWSCWCSPWRVNNAGQRLYFASKSGWVSTRYSPMSAKWRNGSISRTVVNLSQLIKLRVSVCLLFINATQLLEFKTFPYSSTSQV